MRHSFVFYSKPIISSLLCFVAAQLTLQQKLRKQKNLSQKSFSLIICLTFFFSGILNAQPGTPDSSFGINGKVFSETYEGSGNDVAIQSDGKIVVAGTGGYDEKYGFLAVRYNSDGSIDESFGDKGRTINYLGDSNATKIIHKIALQPDGKIIAVGTHNAAIALMRFNVDGSIDYSFGDSGIVIYELSTKIYHIMRDMVLMPDGKIMITGDKERNENDNRTSFIISFTAKGQLDKSFGNKGEVIINTPENADINAIAVTKNNKVLIAGNYTIYKKTILYQFNSNGTSDAGFGINGYAFMNFDDDINSQFIGDISLTQDGAIITAGTVYTKSSNPYSSLITSRFLKNGFADSSYGKNGYSITSNAKTNMGGIALSISPGNNNIIVIGGTNNIKLGLNFIASIKSNGLPDSSFGSGGITYADFIASDVLNSISIQEDGKIVVAGYSLYQNYPDYRYYFIIGRFEGYNVRKDKYLKIKKMLHRHGFTWEDWPGKNIFYYSVQRCNNGESFTEMAKLYNRNNQQQFSYTDTTPLSGDNFYRLDAVSNNGTVVHSNILAIPNNTTAIKLYPNPANNNLVIEGLPVNTKAKLIITDINGVAIMTTTINSNVYNWNINHLKQGNYVLQVVVNGNSIATKKFIKE